MNPYYSDSSVTIFLGDSLQIAPLLVGVGAVISDPPYGMKWNTDSSRFSGGAYPLRRGGKAWPDGVAGDDTAFDPAPWLDYGKVILFGANHFAARLPVGTTLVWVKRNDAAFGTFLSDAEIAWMKGGCGVYCFRDVSMNGGGANFEKMHPTQKTERVMRWCIEKAKVEADEIILDPYMGSGTTLRAAKDLGRRAIGIEINEAYCEIAARRMGQEVLQF